MYQLALQRIEVGRQQRCRFLYACADEAAISAARRTEGNTDVEGNIRVAQTTYRFHGLLGTFDAQTRPLGAHVVTLPHQSECLCRVFARQKRAGGQLRRPNAGQAAPFRRLAKLHGGFVVGALQQTPQSGSVLRFLHAQTATGVGAAAVQVDLHLCGQPCTAAEERTDCAAVFIRYIRKQCKLKLLDGVAFVVAAQFEPHCSASRR